MIRLADVFHLVAPEYPGFGYSDTPASPRNEPPRQKPMNRICGPMRSRFCKRPGLADIETGLFVAYQTNVARYPAWQHRLRTHQPPLLVTRVATTRPSTPLKPRPTSATCPMRRSSCSTPASSPSRSRPTRLQISHAVCSMQSSEALLRPSLAHARRAGAEVTIPCMSVDSRDPVDASRSPPAPCDRASRRWTEQPRMGHPRREETVAALHALLLKGARHELSRRRAQLGSMSGPEFDDLAQQAADDGLVKILTKHEQFAGLSRFTTWTYKFVIFEISHLASSHAWQREPRHAERVRKRATDSFMADPAQRVERREHAATVDQLTARQREALVAVALNDVSIDVLTIELGSNRNAIYQNLFDARRGLRKSMAADGHHVFAEDRTRD